MAGKERKAVVRVLIAMAVLVVAFLGMGAWYINDYYHADSVALSLVDGDGVAGGLDVVDRNGLSVASIPPDDGASSEDGIGVSGHAETEAVSGSDGALSAVDVRTLASGDIAIVPSHPRAGLVFYPGAKVQPESYAPLMQRCAERGVLCVLLKPLFNLAILDSDAADGAIEQFPEVRAWILAGHSMGGVAASECLSRHENDFSGIVFLASYPSADLSGYDGKVVSVVGSCDGVLNRDNYESARSKLPEGVHEIRIEGGNHAYFGNYGEQENDGKATISREEQQEAAASALVGCALP